MLESLQVSWEVALVRKAEAYLHETFGLSARLEACSVEGLPYFIMDHYAFWRADLFGGERLLMALRPETEFSIEEIGRHVDIVRARADGRQAILLFEHLSAARRRALLSHRMAFLVPMAQLFVPEALLDLRERTPRPAARAPERLSPTAQQVILGALLEPMACGQAANATALARRYGVAVMSMSRAFDELTASHLAEDRRDGRQRSLRFHAAGRELWDRAAPRLQSPVLKVRTVVIPGAGPESIGGSVAGESALSLYTDLAEPRMQRLAVPAAGWRQLVRDKALRDTYPRDPAGAEVETWAYDPGSLARGDVVDKLSLHLSLRDHADERVAMAAADLLETFEWS